MRASLLCLSAVTIGGACLFAPSHAGAKPKGTLAVTTVALFDPTYFETPESVQFDSEGNMVISLALTGELRVIAPDGAQSTRAFLPIAPEVVPCENPFGAAILGGAALDKDDNAYVSVGSCDQDQLGVYQVTPQGDVTFLAPLPQGAMANGIAHRHGELYVADTALGLVWNLPTDGSRPPAVWAADALLAPLPDFFPGPNGLQIFHDEVYVSVSDRAHVIAFPIRHDGSAGPARVHATGVGLDDFAFDVHGNLYGTTDPFNTLVRIAPDGSTTVLLTAADGLDGPTSAAFGVDGGDKDQLYVMNAAFPFFSTTHRPSVLKVDIGVHGAKR